MSQLFDSITIRDVAFKNRVWVSPMCQYSSVDGLPNTWHLVHLGKFAVGGAGLVMTESTSVAPNGRISPQDTGIWNDEQVESWSEVVDFIHSQGAAAGIQLGHAGRKASTSPTWEGTKFVPETDGGWLTVGSSSIGYGSLPPPIPLSTAETSAIPNQFAEAAIRANHAGFDVAEIHAAHGYLIHQFLSPLSNNRVDQYGGDFENRVRLLLEVCEAVRAVWPSEKPLFVRISATDWVTDGWDLEQTTLAAKLLGELGVDLIDCSSGGTVSDAKIPTGPGYQVEFAEHIRKNANVATAAVGMITKPEQANQIVGSGQADAVFMARELLRQPNWPLLAASELGVPAKWPVQFERAAPGFSLPATQPVK